MFSRALPELPKRRRSVKHSFAAFVSVVLVSLTSQVYAQQGCDWSDLANPTRQSITCGDALTVERLPGSEVTIFERSGNAPPRVIELKNGAIFIEVVPGSRPTQIKTPHAIAAVRGTIYAIDAGEVRTSVFVVKGAVEVSKTETGEVVSLGPGQGVDVDADLPLEVKTWGDRRASELLARFGR